MLLRSGFVVLAQRLQEAADAMSQNDVRARLSDAVNDAHRGTGHYGGYVDHTGDGETGDCIYYCDGDLRKAPYELSTVGGKLAAKLHTDQSVNVMPVTSYQEEADDDDNYAAMQEAKLYQASDLPLFERFISKKERDAADEGDFAGKGKSFPILKPSDVSAAVHAIGRAGPGNYGVAQLKANIIRIAKRKGWTSELPKAWQGDDAKEAAKRTPGGALQLCESAATLETIRLTEARADYEIKLIAPGPGSSAFYPAEVLKRDGPKVFKSGTHVYLNHPTAAEEAARPEGDVKNLAGVLASDAVYHESHAKGPGLYARMKVFQDHAQTVEEKAPHVGMSIRASGVAESGSRKDGLPVLKSLTSAESVDVVTRAGAGGLILSESARNPQQEPKEMTLEEARKLIAEETAKATAPLRERALKGDAVTETGRILEGLSLHPETKTRITQRVLEMAIPVNEAGELDAAKLRESVVAIAKTEGEYAARLAGTGRVFGMGSTGVTAIDEKAVREARARQLEDEKQMRESAKSIFADLLGSKTAGERAAMKGAA